MESVESLKNHGNRRQNKELILYLLMIPALLWVLCFRILPLFGIQIAFREFNIYDGIWGSRWVGWDNFVKIFSQRRFTQVVRNTLEISLLKLAVIFPVPLIFALMLNEFKSRRYRNFVLSILLIPHFFSYVVIHGIFKDLLSMQGGAVNHVITGLGLDAVNFYSNDMFRVVLLLTEAFKDCGWDTIIYVSALSSVDHALFDAASMDGAGMFRRMWHISLPSLTSVIFLLFILRLGGIMQEGTEQILAMYNPAVYQTADVIGTFVYREGIGSGSYSMAAAIGLFESAVSFILIMGGNAICRKIFHKGVW